MTDRVETLDRERFGVDPTHGFLAAAPPTSLRAADGSSLARLDDLARRLPDLLDGGDLRSTVESLDPPDTGALDGLSEPELVRVYAVSGFLASAYVHEIGAPDVDSIPAGVAVPLHGSTARLDRTPMLSYDAYVLANWTRRDAERPLTPHNLRSITTFTGLEDESWFVRIHVAIEAAAGPAVAAIGDLQQGVVDDDPDRVRDALHAVEDAIRGIVALFERMPEHNEPETYGTAFRAYLGGFNGIEYEGVDALEGPQSYRGGSGAQSSIFPALDAALGIDHDENPLIDHLRTLQRDMPPAHRAFLDAVREGPDLRGYIGDADDELVGAYDDCLDAMVHFRERHVDIVGTYLTARTNDPKGTGGTPFSRFLGTLTDETRAAQFYR